MKFKNVDKFSPVVFYKDLPWQEDYFHLKPEEVTKEFKLHGLYDIDVQWWEKQNERCLNGYQVEDTIDYGGDVYRDEKEAFWNDSMTVNRYVKEIDYVIPPNSCYIPMYDLLIKNKTVRISGRHYFYLNFGKIYALDNSKEKKIVSAEYEDMKGLNSPMFTDVDWGFFVRISNMFRFRKDTSEMKTRQLGYSRKSGIGLMGFNFTFLPHSQTIVAGGMSDDADNTFSICRDFLETLNNTQFYKEKKRGGDRDDFVKALRFGSEVRSISCKDNTQALSRFSPFLTVFEECFGKGTKVLMSNGSFKKIENIKVGDIVKTNSGKNIEVAITQKGFDNLYLIEQSKGENYVVNSKHRLYLELKTNIRDYVKEDGIKKITVSEVEKLIKSKRKSLFGKKCSGVNYPKKLVKIDPYILGLWLGDGASKSFTLTTQDDILETVFIDFARSKMLNHKTTYYKNSKNRKVSISDGNAYCKKLLEKMNLYGNKHIPKDYFINSIDTRLQLLAGIIDTDGYLIKSPSYSFAYEVSQKDCKFVYDIIELCRSTGFYVTVREVFIKGKKYFKLRITGDIKKIPVRLERKKAPDDYTHTNNTTDSQIKIKDIGVGEYFGITLKTENDEDRVLIINDYTLSMNCGKWKKGLIKKVSEFNRAAQKAQGKKTGFNVFIGTGGDMDAGAADMETIHYNPDSYTVMSYENIWEKDDSCITKKSGHFTPGWQFKIMDDNGNSLKEASLKFLDDELKLKKEVAERYIFKTQFAVYAADAFMIASGGFFGEDIVLRCNARKAHIITHGLDDKKKVGRMEWKDPKHPLKGVNFFNDEKGSITIFEEPEIDNNGKVYENLYKSGIDSYDQNEAKTSESKGDIRIYKTFLNANKTYNKFVAKCTDRPTEAEGGKDVWYENTAKLNIYYNIQGASLLEWSKILIAEWYKNNGFEFLLKERPGLTISTWIKKTDATNRYGIDTTTKLHWLTKYRKWLEIPENIEGMDDIEQLTAVAKFKLDPKYNCDTTIACSLAIVCAEDDIEMEVRSSSDQQNNEKLRKFKRVGDKLIQLFD